jgi:hypothetical protein
MPRRTHFTITPRFIKDVTAFIRAGGFAHVAAEAAGVPADVFDAWLARGHKKVRRVSNPLYRQLHDEVRTAKAQARLKAEMAVLEDNPAKWLQQGPGKEKPEQEGWTVPVKPIVREGNQTINVLLSPQMQGLFATILQLLEPYPEARARIAEALAGKERPLIGT